MAVRSWIRNLIAPRTTQSVPAFKPTFAAMEQRDCPAVALFAAGELLVLGNPLQSDTVHVATQGHDVVVTDGQREIFRRAADSVKGLTVLTGLGADHVTVDLNGAGNTLASSLRVLIDTGSGNDDVNCTCENIATTINSNVYLGTGDDRLVGTSINSAATANHIERIDAGTGNDRIDCVQINPAGGVDTTMIGGNGNDTLFGHLVGSQKTADLSFTAIGGNGADTINLLAEGTVHGQLAFDIQGGNGADQIGLAFNLAGPSTPGSLPPSTVTIGGNVDAGKGDDRVTVDPGNPFNLAQVQFPQLMQFNGGDGTDVITVAGGVPLNMLPIAPTSFEVM